MLANDWYSFIETHISLQRIAINSHSLNNKAFLTLNNFNSVLFYFGAVDQKYREESLEFLMLICERFAFVGGGGLLGGDDLFVESMKINRQK